VPVDEYAAIAGLQIMQGRKFVDGRDEMMADTAWLARRKAKIGDKFSIYERNFEIVGTYEPSAGARIKIPLATMQQQLGSENKASAFLIKIKDGLTPTAVGDNLSARFPDNQIILTSELEELYMQGIPALSIFLDVVVAVAGVISALIICYAWLKPAVVAPVEEGRRLMDSIGWAAVLPQMLAALGAVFAAAGVGTTIGALASAIIPEGSIFLAVLLYAFGMVVFTMIMGNAFAAFPVMAAAIGVPILIQADGGNPAVIGAVGMLAGFCGTLMTPMAANFNIVPAALLELKNQYGVIRAQVPTALPLLIANILILYIAGFRL